MRKHESHNTPVLPPAYLFLEKYESNSRKKFIFEWYIFSIKSFTKTLYYYLKKDGFCVRWNFKLSHKQNFVKLIISFRIIFIYLYTYTFIYTYVSKIFYKPIEQLFITVKKFLLFLIKFGYYSACSHQNFSMFSFLYATEITRLNTENDLYLFL